MTHEWEIRAALATEFGENCRYARPDYGTIRAELEALQVDALRGETIAALVPSRTDTRWMHDICFRWHVRFIRGRVVFDGHDAGAPFPSMLVVMGPEYRNTAVPVDARCELSYRHWVVPRAQLGLLEEAVGS